MISDLWDSFPKAL